MLGESNSRTKKRDDAYAAIVAQCGVSRNLIQEENHRASSQVGLVLTWWFSVCAIVGATLLQRRRPLDRRLRRVPALLASGLRLGVGRARRLADDPQVGRHEVAERLGQRCAPPPVLLVGALAAEHRVEQVHATQGRAGLLLEQGERLAFARDEEVAAHEVSLVLAPFATAADPLRHAVEHELRRQDELFGNTNAIAAHLLPPYTYSRTHPPWIRPGRTRGRL